MLGHSITVQFFEEPKKNWKIHWISLSRIARIIYFSLLYLIWKFLDFFFPFALERSHSYYCSCSLLASFCMFHLCNCLSIYVLIVSLFCFGSWMPSFLLSMSFLVLHFFVSHFEIKLVTNQKIAKPTFRYTPLLIWIDNNTS